jgi:hypothetical protein
MQTDSARVGCVREQLTQEEVILIDSLSSSEAPRILRGKEIAREKALEGVPRLLTAHEMLEQAPTESVTRARLRVQTAPRERLLSEFRYQLRLRRRMGTLLVADELVRRGIPPAFWHREQSPGAEYPLEQRLDLVCYDLRWIRAQHPQHSQSVRYARYKSMLIGSEAMFFNEARFLFYGGRRRIWQMVQTMSLTLDQQYECYLLRSAPVETRLGAIAEAGEHVMSALRTHACTIRKGRAFDLQEALQVAVRRHRIWSCAQVCGGRPTATAKRYEQLTGTTLTRQVVSNQLELIGKILEDAGLTKLIRVR